MLVKDFDYELPKELIAQYPSQKREESKLLVLHRRSQEIEHRRFYDIVDYFTAGDVIVLNETKVIPARLIGRRIDTDGKVEVFLLKPLEPLNSPTLNSLQWEVLISPGRARKIGIQVKFGSELWGEVKSIHPRTIFEFHSTGHRLVLRFCEQNDSTGISPQTFNALLQKYGQVPLPPYIKREPISSDSNRYQTVYAKVPGACAAPTAGLHFTHSILNKLIKKGVKVAKIVLHTGIGTFKPMKCEKVEDHQMEPEYYEIPESAVRKINDAKRVIAVGTTVVRALETSTGGLLNGKGWTNKFIYPPYKFKVVDVLVTNFHLPKSTLLLLVSAFADWSETEIPSRHEMGRERGKELIFEAYAEAISRRYRFYSYGDAMLII